MTKQPMTDQWKERKPFCKFWCNWCEKLIDTNEVTMAVNRKGSAVFYHHDNHQVEIDISSELEKVRQEAEDNMRKRCVEALPKKRTTYKYMATPTINADFTAFGGKKIVAGEPFENESTLSEEDIIFNEAIDQATQNINNLDKRK